MRRELLGHYLIRLFLIGILSLLFQTPGFSRNTMPNTVERQQEEYTLKLRLRSILLDVLKEQYVAVSTNILYVPQNEPIVSSKSQIRTLNLPGFGTRVSITRDPNDISGYIHRYQRYRIINLMIRNRLSPSVEESIAKLLRDKAKLDIGRKDIFKILVIADEREIGIENTPVNPDEKRTNKGHTNKIDTLVRKLGNERKEKRKRLAQLFPDLKQPIGQIDPRKEAESSKHLILSRKAYYNNDLNTALNEVIESINVNPYASKSYEMLGSIYYRLKWRNLALNNWEKALALDPDNKKLNKFIDKIKTEL